MVFLHINPTSKTSEEFDKHIENKDKQIFLLIFMDGCGPCEATKPEWENIESKLSDDLKQNENLIIADLNQESIKDIKNLPTQPKGFPTMFYITNGGKICESFDERDVDSFIKWIESKVGKQGKQENLIKLEGGKRNRNKKSKKSKKNKKSKKSKKNKKSKKSKKNRSNKNK